MTKVELGISELQHLIDMNLRELGRFRGTSYRLASDDRYLYAFNKVLGQTTSLIKSLKEEIDNGKT